MSFHPYHFEYLEPYHSNNMARSSRNTPRTPRQNPENPSFYSNTTDAFFARDKMTEEPFRYFQNVSYLKKPAEVTDALRAAHPRLAVYDRNSMKGGIARMLKQDQTVIDKILSFFGTNGRSGMNTNRDDEQHDEGFNVQEQPVSEARRKQGDGNHHGDTTSNKEKILKNASFYFIFFALTN